MTLTNNTNKTAAIGDKISTVLFVIFAAVLVLRCTYMENASIASLNLEGSFHDIFYSLCFSGILIFIFLYSLGVKIIKGQLNLKKPLAIGTIIFIIATIISTFTASNKSAAIINSVTILAPMLAAIALIDILHSSAIRKMLLIIIVAIAVANTYQSAGQLVEQNNFMIEEYEKAPNVQLDKLGIEPGSFQHMLYEHRLKSKDVKGFFTTGNTAGGFAVLAIFCGIAVWANFFEKEKLKKHPKEITIAFAIIMVVFAGLLITHSKGGIISMMAGSTCYLAWLAFGPVIKKFRYALIFVGIAAFAIFVCAIISYGLKNGTLPGGNSMLVRWQYWFTAAKIIADNWITGIGGGNFASYYMQYKIPATLETVRDPHCFVLSILSQFGILGIVGFMTALTLPIGAILLRKESPLQSNENDNILAIAKAVGFTVILAMILIRPILVKVPMYGPITVVIYVIAIMYIAPAFVITVVLWLGSIGQKKLKSPSISTAALICGIAAFILHNLIDFAIFEPGVLTAFWAIVACVIATNKTDSKTTDINKKLNGSMKLLTVSILTTVALLYIYFVLTPAASTAYCIDRATFLLRNGRINDASALMQRATHIDRLNPTPAQIKGKMLLGTLSAGPQYRDPALSTQAEIAFLAAANNNPKDFKNYEKLAELYEISAQLNQHQRMQWNNKSKNALKKAIELYPGNADLYIKLGKICDQLNDNLEALAAYKQAVKIEDEYTQMFKVMYPGKDVFSRLGKRKYKFALERIDELENKNEN